MYHQLVFGAFVISGGVRTTYLLRGRGGQAADSVPPETKSTVLRMFWTGGALFVLGFIVWNLDNVLCGALTRAKVAIGWPSAFLIEGAPRILAVATSYADGGSCAGHAWWHILTAAGVYLMMQGVTCRHSFYMHRWSQNIYVFLQT